MPKRVIDLRDGKALLNIGSYARGGIGRRDRLSSAEIAHIRLTVERAPEVMIKVLVQGEQSLAAITQHLNYIGRKGELELEGDDGDRWEGKHIGKKLLEDWDLDLEVSRRRAELAATTGRKPPKLVHKLMFSMPPGTPPDKLLSAVRNFAREEFGLKHRYALVLHTDEPHPHVHMVVKAMSEQGVRLNIRKATLRDWRAEFARQLRAQGVAANATERAVRGQSTTRKRDGIYRAALRGASSHMQRRAAVVAGDLLKGGLQVEPVKAKLLATRAAVRHGWAAVAVQLKSEGQDGLAERIRQFVGGMAPVLTENEGIAQEILQKVAVRAPELRQTR